MKKKQKVTSHIKGQDKTPQKTTKLSGGRQPYRKRVQNNHSNDSGYQKKNGGKDWEDARNVYQGLQELKHKQTEMNNTPEGITNRVTEAEERKNDLEDRMQKSLPQNRI